MENPGRTTEGDLQVYNVDLEDNILKCGPKYTQTSNLGTRQESIQCVTSKSECPQNSHAAMGHRTWTVMLHVAAHHCHPLHVGL